MNPYIGTIVLWAGSYAPVNWAFCDGKLLPINQYQVVAAVLGNKYGGDGKTNIALPNLPTVADTDGIGVSRYIICLQGDFPAMP
jgi:microcystin-dependent protein